MIRGIIAVTTLLLLTAPAAVDAGGAATATPIGSLYFNDATDTIAIDGQTILDTNATYEAVVYFPASTGAFGLIFNEWTFGQEDKQFFAGPDGIRGYNEPVGFGNVILYTDPIAADAWHHVAFVQDSSNSEQRLYLDGTLVTTEALSGEIGDGAGQGFIGGIFRDTHLDSFGGFIDMFRISNNARYSGGSFTAPTGDLADDASTLLLYNFNAPDFFVDQGQVRITDLSGNGRTGTLGGGAGTPTSPEPPAKLGDVDCSGGINSVDALKLLRYSAALSVSQTEPCPNIGETLLPALFGDVDCDGNINSVDALKVLRHSASLNATQEPGCPAFNSPT